ncbi:MAG: glycoside hydrolase family 25 protein [Candidatus Zixiibacteriota bacterium]|nr:MAG: glycoside hydrolase family 25 protein [candidate division Zixibacteria bacterium]
MKRAILIIIPALVVLGALLTWAYFEGYWRFNYPDQDKYPVRGIDVSHHQSEIDWDQVALHEFDFVYMKATEGIGFKDKQFARNWEEASRVGIVKGAYHFFSFCKPGIEQARNFIATVPVEPNTLPPAIDFEFGGNCSSPPEKQEILKELTDFIREIETAYGVVPILYVTYPAYDHYLAGELPGYHVWIHDKFWTPKLSDGRAWTFWQYANRGRVKGISGPCDLNVFSGPREAFTALKSGKL